MGKKQEHLEELWRIKEMNKPLRVYDECLICGDEGRLLEGLCLHCWVKKQSKGVMS